MAGKILCLTLVVGVAWAATWQGRPPQKPKEFANKEGCYIDEVKDVIPYGSVLTPIGHCFRIECNQDLIHYASCGVVNTDDPNCYITETDLSRRYPDCCPTIKCDIDNNLI
ncbi:unnamed protein product, partial [Iphiclides podalirius]